MLGWVLLLLGILFKIISLLEPIGGAIPKFSSDSKSLGSFEKNFGESLALLCPAQAYPLPSYRYS